MKKSRKPFYILISVIVIAILAGGIVYATSLSDRGKEIGKQSADIEKNGSDRIVATINGEKITQKVFDKNKYVFNLNHTYTDKEVLDKMIERRVLFAQAVSEGLEVGDEEVSAAVQTVKTTVEQDKEQAEFLNSYLEGLGISDEQYWTEIVPKEYKQVLTIDKLYQQLRDAFIKSSGLSDPDEIKAQFDIQWKAYKNTLVSSAEVETSLK